MALFSDSSSSLFLRNGGWQGKEKGGINRGNYRQDLFINEGEFNLRDVPRPMAKEKMTWEELQAVKNHQHYDSYYEA